jgi:hypothetical protein
MPRASLVEQSSTAVVPTKEFVSSHIRCGYKLLLTSILLRDAEIKGDDTNSLREFVIVSVGSSQHDGYDSSVPHGL